MRRLPARSESLLFSRLSPGVMSVLVSGVATSHSRGLLPGFVHVWMAFSLVAFPVVLIGAACVRRLVARGGEPHP